MPYIVTLFLYFVVYSFLGWCCETVYCSTIQKHFVNRGFLYGPLCPIYGCGALLVLFLLRDVSDSLVPLFLSGLVVTTVLEYLTSVLMEKLFHMKWWDYSHLPFNINGRVCLLNSCEFGALSVFVVRVLHPAIVGLVDRLSVMAAWIVAIVLLAVILTDTVITVRGLLILKGKLDDIYDRIEEIRLKTEEGSEKLRLALTEKGDDVRRSIRGRTDELKESLAVRAEILQGDYEQYKERMAQSGEELQKNIEEGREESRRKLAALKERIQSLDTSRIAYRHMFRAFPNLRISQNERFSAQLRDKLVYFHKSKEK